MNADDCHCGLGITNVTTTHFLYISESSDVVLYRLGFVNTSCTCFYYILESMDVDGCHYDRLGFTNVSFYISESLYVLTCWFIFGFVNISSTSFYTMYITLNMLLCKRGIVIYGHNSRAGMSLYTGVGALYYARFYVSNSYRFLFVSPSFTVPRTACVGTGVALFRRPFEARPCDAFRRESFRQQAVPRSPWFAPSSVPLYAQDLTPRQQESVGPVPPVRAKRKRQKRY